MEKSIREIAGIIGATVIGDETVIIRDLKPLEEAGEYDLTFIAQTKFLKMLAATRAAAVIVPPGTVEPGKNLIIADDPYLAFGKLLGLFYPVDHGRPGISPDAYIEDGASVSPEAVVHPRSFISRGARIERGAVIYPGVFIGKDVTIGEDSILYANVSVYAGSIIGRRVILHSGVVIGADGFGFAAPGEKNAKIPQVGIVQIDDDVELGANTTVDRATMGKTWVQRNVKVDNLVQIAHNVVIGEKSAIAAQTGISGSTTIGKSVMIGGQVGIVGHVTIGDRAAIAASSGINKNIPEGFTGGGIPPLPFKEWMRVEAAKIRLPDMRVKLLRLIRQVEELEKKINKTGKDEV